MSYLVLPCLLLLGCTAQSNAQSGNERLSWILGPQGKGDCNEICKRSIGKQCSESLGRKAASDVDKVELYKTAKEGILGTMDKDSPNAQTQGAVMMAHANMPAHYPNGVAVKLLMDLPLVTTQGFVLVQDALSTMWTTMEMILALSAIR
eukprot:TRINITY_DN361_c0_g1_i4.p1 TRINITY_DN361_c0_g1~~TRINITY_DN361_c0_g1_i4.p1  ORF type:complete len:149 (-),score=21.11 TRINITY_DN361_c0_g1_i4:286-732(-)